MCWLAKRIGAIATERMPVGTGKTQIFFHGFARYYFIFIIPAIGKRIIAFRAFIFYLAYAFKKFFFSVNN